jgi:formamidopyrimidine-DNA glycosylase
MPELPDIVIYLDALERRILGHQLDRIRIANPFLLRTISPPPQAVQGARVSHLRRLGKRIVITFDNGISLVIHLMIAGRFQWVDTPGAPIKKKLGLAAFDFDNGTLTLTEAGTTRRASLHVVDEAGLR